MTPRLKILAYELAKGETVESAMLIAGYAPKTAKAGRIIHNKKLVPPRDHPEVAAEIDTLLAAARKGSATTVHDLADKLEKAYDVAEKNGSASGMVAAAMGLGKLLGLVIDRKQLSLKRLADMTPEELDFVMGKDDEPRDHVH